MHHLAKSEYAGRPLHPVRRRRDQRQRQPLPQGVAAAGLYDLLQKAPRDPGGAGPAAVGRRG